MHGAAAVTEDSFKRRLASLSGVAIIRSMLKHVWPKDRPDLKRRVIAAVGLLIAAKVGRLSK